MTTLPDFLDYYLKILSIGLNPSTISVEKGFYFANPRNRFWKALNQSKLIDEEVTPAVEIHQLILNKYKIGFTDVVKKYSNMGKDLKAVDYKKSAPKLKTKIKKFKPKICWFHGKIAASKYMKYAENKSLILNWGIQNFKLADSIVFISPNTSPANAVYSLDDIVFWFNELHNINKSMH